MQMLENSDVLKVKVYCSYFDGASISKGTMTHEQEKNCKDFSLVSPFVFEWDVQSVSTNVCIST